MSSKGSGAALLALGFLGKIWLLTEGQEIQGNECIIGTENSGQLQSSLTERHGLH